MTARVRTLVLASVCMGFSAVCAAAPAESGPPKKAAVTAPAVAAKKHSYGTYCEISVQFRDGVALSSDIGRANLRIGKEGKVRVFVTNTTTVDLLAVGLEAQSLAFDCVAKPSADWEEFPDLKTMRKGGKPQAFDVTLTRKPNVPDGEYEVTFRLLNLTKLPIISVPLSALARTPVDVKRANVTIDGRMDAAEWAAAPACTALCDYRSLAMFAKRNDRPYLRSDGYEVSKAQTRFRAACDDTHLFFCVDFLEPVKAVSDMASIYVAPNLEAEPTELRIDRLTKSCTTKIGDAGIRVAADETGRVFEIAVPRTLVGIEKTGSFYANFARTIDLGRLDEPVSRHTRFLYDADSPDPAHVQQAGLKVMADKDNVSCTLNFDEIAKKTLADATVLTVYMVPDGPPQGNPLPRRFTVSIRDKKVSCSDPATEAAALKYEVADDGKTAALTIPRPVAGIGDSRRFFVHAEFLGEKQVKGGGIVRSFWRGNQYSVASPGVYELFALSK